MFVVGLFGLEALPGQWPTKTRAIFSPLLWIHMNSQTDMWLRLQVVNHGSFFVDGYGAFLLRIHLLFAGLMTLCSHLSGPGS